MKKGRGRPGQDKKEMAQMLVEAALLGDVAASKKYGVTRQTLLNYRKLLQDDPIFFALFEQASNQFITRPWAEELDEALSQTIAKMAQMVQAQTNSDPEALEAVVGAFRALSEMQLAREVLDAAPDSDEARATQEAQAGTQQTSYSQAN